MGAAVRVLPSEVEGSARSPFAAARPQLRLVVDAGDHDGHGGGRQPGRLRVTVRGWIVVGAAVAALVLTLALLTGHGGAQAGGQRALVGGTATVAPGDTLWDVAEEHAPPGTDLRTYVAEVRALNGLDDATVPAWTVVLLPRR